jgi:hypothetical protein
MTNFACSFFLQLTFYNCISDVEVVVVLVPADFGHENWQVVFRAALDAEPEAAVDLTLQDHFAELKNAKGADYYMMLHH